MRSARRQYLLAVLFIAVGALGIWWGLSRPWLSYDESLLGIEADDLSSLGAATTLVQSSGARLFPFAAAMPLLMLAGIAGVVGSSGKGRQIVGAIISLAAALAAVVPAVALAAGLATYAPESARDVQVASTMPILVVLAAIGGLIGGLLVLVRGTCWPTLGRSYERAPKKPRNAWDVLDSGEDPTLDPDEALMDPRNAGESSNYRADDPPAPPK